MAKDAVVAAPATAGPAPDSSGMCPAGYARNSAGQCYPISTNDQIRSSSADIPTAGERMLDSASGVAKEVARSTPLPESWWDARPPSEMSWVEHALTAGTQIPTDPARFRVPSRAAIANVAAGATPTRQVTRDDPAVAMATTKGAANNDKTPQRDPPPSATGKDEKKGTGPALAGDGYPAGPYRIPGSPGYEESRRDLPMTMKLPDGSVVTVPEAEAKGLRVSTPAGWDAQAEARKFLAGRLEQQAAREAPAPGPKVGRWTFSGGLGTGKARTGEYTPSSAENTIERNRFQDQVEARRQADQMRDLGMDVERAKADYTMRMMGMDPLAMARIQAEGRYGGQMIRAQADQEARIAALVEYRRTVDAVMATMPPGTQRDQALMQIARDAANILLGNRVTDPNAMAQMFSMLGMGASLGMGAAGGATAAGEKK